MNKKMMNNKSFESFSLIETIVLGDWFKWKDEKSNWTGKRRLITSNQEVKVSKSVIQVL